MDNSTCTRVCVSFDGYDVLVAVGRQFLESDGDLVIGGCVQLEFAVDQSVVASVRVGHHETVLLPTADARGQLAVRVADVLHEGCVDNKHDQQLTSPSVENEKQQMKVLFRAVK